MPSSSDVSVVLLDQPTMLVERTPFPVKCKCDICCAVIPTSLALPVHNSSFLSVGKSLGTRLVSQATGTLFRMSVKNREQTRVHNKKTLENGKYCRFCCRTRKVRLAFILLFVRGAQILSKFSSKLDSLTSMKRYF